MLSFATATFKVSQFDGVQIAYNATITGSAGFNGVVLKGSYVNLSDFDFASWGLGDRITAQGTTANDLLIGSLWNETFNGGGGNDEIDGATGSDRLYGGSGNDSFSTEYDGDADLFDGGGGIDTFNFYSIGGSYDLSLDIRDGGDGRDIGNGTTVTRMEVVSCIFYSTGTVEFWGGAYADAVATGVANDYVNGMAGNDYLESSGGSDIVIGGTGNDTLVGGSGLDVLKGGKGADIFFYENSSDSPDAAHRDTILDFTKGIDTIDLSHIDANSNTTVPNQPGGDSFHFIGTQQFHDIAGELRYAKTRAGDTFVLGDTNGDGFTDFQIKLTGLISLVSADFDL